MMDAEPGEARFDPILGAWILSSFSDVAAALREPRLSASGAGSDGQSAHVALREAAARALSPERLTAWRVGMERSAHRLAGSLPADRPVDLVRAFAEPWSHELAMAVTGAAPADAERLTGTAREIFLAAACATSSDVQPEAHAATVALASSFPGAGATIAVQSFVALSQTLPCVLAGAWRALFGDPEVTGCLRARPELMPQAVEELLRLAGPSHAVFRRAIADVAIGGACVSRGDRVILMLSAANRDPAQFRAPGRLDLRRGAAGHFALGRGTHACSGAMLIRMAVGVATTALLKTTRAVEPIDVVDWIGGFAIRAPASLPVVLRRERADGASAKTPAA